MSRLRFSEPGERVPLGKRAVLLRVGGELIRESDFRKSLRQERGINGKVRRRHSNELGGDITSILEDFREAIEIEEAQAAVMSGRASVIVNAAAANELEAELTVALSQNLEAALADGVEIGLRFAPEVLGGVPMSFATEAAVAAVEQSAGLASLGVTQSTQSGIQEILKLGLKDDLAPVEVAGRIGDLAGLDPRRVRAVDNYRKNLEKRLIPREPLDPRTGLPAADTPAVRKVIDQETDGYARRMRLDRGRTIAETETQKAIAAGEDSFWHQASLSDEVDEAGIWKTWRTVDDGKVCPICFPLHGQTVLRNAMFQTAVGPLPGRPAHPRCRCFLQYGNVGPGGQVAESPDRGEEAVREQQAVRLLTPETISEDLQLAQRRVDRITARLGKTRPGTKIEAKLRASIGVNAATVESLEARLAELGGEP